VLGTLPVVLGSLQATAAVRRLLGWGAEAAPRILLVDAESMETRELVLTRRTDCDGCSEAVREGKVGLSETPAFPGNGPVGDFEYIEPRALEEELRGHHPPTIVDVRNASERAVAGFPGGRWIPLESLMDRVGELSDAAAIDRAVQGADAVVSALGPSLSRKATGLPLVGGTRNIVAAMQRHGVRRYVGNGTPSVLDPRERPTWQTRLSTFMAKTFLRRAYDELVGMSEIVMTSGLDWTIVRFLAPKDGPACGRLRQGFYGHDRLGFGVTRAAIAAFTAAQVDDARYIGAAPAISN